MIADLASADRRAEASLFVRSAPLTRLVGGEDGGPVGRAMPRRTDLRPSREHRPHRGPPHVGGVGVRLSGPAGPLPVGASRLGDERDKAPRPAARRAREGVDLEDLVPERRPATGGLGRRKSYGGDDRRTNPSTVS